MRINILRQTDRQTDRRNYGIDLLRLYSMFLITILHVLGHGGVLETAQGANWSVAWFLEISAYCAVNCFALISGFVCYSDEEKPYRYRKYISFWLHVFIYSFGIALVVYILKPQSIGLKDLIKYALPVTLKKYWYVSAYTGLFFMIPWLNKFMRVCTKRECTILLVTFTALFCVHSRVGDPYSLSGGYSFAWLVILYIVGAWMKKYHIPDFLKKRVWFVLLSGCIFVSWLWKNYSPIYSGLFVHYVSPTILLVAISCLSVFSKLVIGDKLKQIIRFFSPAAFGVYLVHEHPIIRDHFIKNSFIWISSSSPVLLAVQVLACAFGIFAVCLAIDLIRICVFKLIKVDRIVDRVSDKINDKIRPLLSKII